MRSSNILEVAERAGLWDSKTQGKKVDFTSAFALDSDHMISNIRRWRVYSWVGSSSMAILSKSSIDEPPFSVTY
jgi:hypothetical protein